MAPYSKTKKAAQNRQTPESFQLLNQHKLTTTHDIVKRKLNLHFSNNKSNIVVCKKTRPPNTCQNIEQIAAIPNLRPECHNSLNQSPQDTIYWRTTFLVLRSNTDKVHIKKEKH